MNTTIENIKNTLTVGLVLAAASELLIRTSVSTLENAGARFNGEAKRAMTNFIDSTHKVQYWYDRLQERSSVTTTAAWRSSTTCSTTPAALHRWG